MYQPHPAFAKDAQGRYRYHTDHALTQAELGGRRSPWEFEQQGTRELVADDFVYALKRHATTRIEAPVYAVFAEYVIGLKDYAELIKREDAKLLAGLAGRPAGQTVPRLPALAAGGRAGDRPLHVSHPPEGQVPAMALLDGDAIHRAAAVGGRRVLRAAGHGRGGAVAEPMADRHRAVHDAHLPARSTARARAQPQLPRRHLSVRRAARRQGRGPARRLRQAHAVRRQAVRHDRERAHAAQGEVQAGLSRRARDRAARLGRRIQGQPGRLRRGEAPVRGTQIPVSAHRRHLQLVPRLQHARPGGRQPRHGAESASATASCVRRSRSPSTGKRATAASSATRAAMRRTARCRRACMARASRRPASTTR